MLFGRAVSGMLAMIPSVAVSTTFSAVSAS
jgi:hypothetical protein